MQTPSSENAKHTMELTAAGAHDREGRTGCPRQGGWGDSSGQGLARQLCKVRKLAVWIIAEVHIVLCQLAPR